MTDIIVSDPRDITIRGVVIPFLSGYNFDDAPIIPFGKKVEPSKEIPPTDVEKEKYKERLHIFNSITRCQNPECGGTSIFPYYDSSEDRFHIKCSNVPNHIYNNMESILKGEEFKKQSNRSSSSSPRKKTPVKTPLKCDDTGKIRKLTVYEYAESIQGELCRWHISF
jgi:hypothetical protein